MRFCAPSAEPFGSKQRIVARIVAVRLAFFLCVLPWGQSLLTFSTLETEVVPILTQRSLALSYRTNKDIHRDTYSNKQQHMYTHMYHSEHSYTLVYQMTLYTHAISEQVGSHHVHTLTQKRALISFPV